MLIEYVDNGIHKEIVYIVEYFLLLSTENYLIPQSNFRLHQVEPERAYITRQSLKLRKRDRKHQPISTGCAIILLRILTKMM
jgi:hypothetical protein